ncbi:hypothetical protein GOODEAATRI_023120 [Goodea atripinnis]|uniref:Uncharacterized protein n=1 Tax=Goodea atripinnis TaxID=208336 RepID=A0ABV0MWJ4_9TELE
MTVAMVTLPLPNGMFYCVQLPLLIIRRPKFRAATIDKGAIDIIPTTSRRHFVVSLSSPRGFCSVCQALTCFFGASGCNGLFPLFCRQKPMNLMTLEPAIGVQYDTDIPKLTAFDSFWSKW